MTDQRPLRVGDQVRHYDSGWSGTVAQIVEDNTGMRGTQGPLVTVDPVEAGGKTWSGITVTEEELELVTDGE